MEIVELCVMIITLAFALALAVKPVKNFGLLNFVIGLFGLVGTLYLMTSFTAGYEFFFGLMVVFTSILCMIRSDGITRLP